MLTMLADAMRQYKRPWFVAGGWALDLFVGRQTRTHGDLDIAIWREDQCALRKSFEGWSFDKAVKGELCPWLEGEEILHPIHEVHARRGVATMEFLMNERIEDAWQYRRNSKVTLALDSFSRRSTDGLPYLAPEVVLLYKAKAPRELDQRDFDLVLPLLDGRGARWLKSVLAICHPGHPWQTALSSCAGV